ncbi:MAG: homocysteine S-methyltransferase family protein [Candidatus Sumerlaeaceae bacterium]|nr:homocysteine S-methyltransferase family protein [Candidatus Sumerlaeaceae bacterium]
MKPSLLEALKTRILVGDGAMGTQLQLAGLEPGGPGEVWNADEPDRVKAIQQRYADAGSDIIITNTFGANRSRLSLHGHEERAFELNKTGAAVARQVMGSDRYVLGDIGPFGGFIEPLGEASRGQVVEWFDEQARGLLEGGVDGFIIETMTALDEIECAIQAIRRHSKLPIVASLAFDKTQTGTFRTMMGVSPTQAATHLTNKGADIIACNCGTGLEIGDYAAIVAEFRSATSLPIMAQPNAGMPELTDDGVVYHETPEMMTKGIPAIAAAGARIIGGCCGTTPEHIRLFRAEIDRLGT